jgi:hypothetical protein
MTSKCRCTGARQRGVRATCHATEPTGMPDFTKTTSTPPRCTWSICSSPVPDVKRPIYGHSTFTRDFNPYF